MTPTIHETGTLQSGDVALFYQHFGRPGAAPLLILHGANYYDSQDWTGVAAALAADREVVAFDSRGFGASSWSASKDYSLDAIMDDINVLLDHFGWTRAVIAGHSLGGSFALLFGARFPQRTAGVVLVDHCPGEGGAARAPVPSSAAPKAFPTLAAALAATSRDQRTPLARVEAFCRPVDGGYAFRRDPAFSNRTPATPGWTPKITVSDAWQELAQIQAPLGVIRATQSDRFDDARIARVRQVQPAARVAEVASGHDVVTGAQDAVIAALRSFLSQPKASAA